MASTLFPMTLARSGSSWSLCRSLPGGGAAVRQRGEARNPYLAPRVTASGTGYNANRGSTCHRALLWELRVIALAVAAARVSEFTCNNPYLPLKR